MTKAERREAATILETLLEQIDAGEVEATRGAVTYLTGVLEGLRA